jgi:hypothetical protein
LLVALLALIVLNGLSGPAYAQGMCSNADKGKDCHDCQDRCRESCRGDPRCMDRCTRGCNDRCRDGGGASKLASAMCAIDSYGVSFMVCLGGFAACDIPTPDPRICAGGLFACYESVSGAREKFEKCIEESKATTPSPARDNHGGQPAGSPGGAAAACAF